MIFLSPIMFLYILLFIPVLYILFILYKNKIKFLHTLYNHQYIAKMKLKTFLFCKVWASLFLILGITFSLTTPKLVNTSAEEKTDNISYLEHKLYIVLDVSKSMYVKDSNNNTRMYTAVQFLKQLTTQNVKTSQTNNNKTKYYEMALIVFTNKPALVVPLTSDYVYLQSVLESFIEQPRIDGPSDLKSVVQSLHTNKNVFFQYANGGKSKQIFGSKNVISKHTQLFFVSDGEFHTFTKADIFSKFSQEGFVITSVAVGSKEGGTVPNFTNIQSKANPLLMKNLARFSGGKYIKAEESINNKPLIPTLTQNTSYKDIRFIGYFIAFLSSLVYIGTIIL